MSRTIIRLYRITPECEGRSLGPFSRGRKCIEFDVPTPERYGQEKSGSFFGAADLSSSSAPGQSRPEIGNKKGRTKLSTRFSKWTRGPAIFSSFDDLGSALCPHNHFAPVPKHNGIRNGGLFERRLDLRDKAAAYSALRPFSCGQRVLG